MYTLHNDDFRKDPRFQQAYARGVSDDEALTAALHTTLAERKALDDEIVGTEARKVYADGQAMLKRLIDGRWLQANGVMGLFQISTLPDMRRRGFGRAIIEALIRWGQGQGATEAYLQVERKNEGARALYRSFGFQTAYDYSYWWVPDTVEIATKGS